MRDGKGPDVSPGLAAITFRKRSASHDADLRPGSGQPGGEGKNFRQICPGGPFLRIRLKNLSNLRLGQSPRPCPHALDIRVPGSCPP